MRDDEAVAPEPDIDENDPDVLLQVHPADDNPGAVTINFPFTWFTGYESAGPDPAPTR